MYKMKCPRCGEEMKYTKNEEMEKLDVVVMDCINNCEGGYLVPINNPDLIKINYETIYNTNDDANQ